VPELIQVADTVLPETVCEAAEPPAKAKATALLAATAAALADTSSAPLLSSVAFATAPFTYCCRPPFARAMALALPLLADAKAFAAIDTVPVLVIEPVAVPVTVTIARTPPLTIRCAFAPPLPAASTPAPHRVLPVRALIFFFFQAEDGIRDA